MGEKPTQFVVAPNDKQMAATVELMDGARRMTPQQWEKAMRDSTYSAAYHAAYKIEGTIADLGLGQDARAAYKKSLDDRLNKTLWGD